MSTKQYSVLHVLQQLEEVKADGSVNEASRQVALADVLIVNKVDLVSSQQLGDVTVRIRCKLCVSKSYFPVCSNYV